MLHEDENVAPEKTMLSRRKVVGTALWVAPAITVLSAAPALAASGDTLSWATSPSAPIVGGSGNTQFTIGFTVRATSTHSTAAAIAVTITFPAVDGAITLPTTVPTGWHTTSTGTVAAGGSVTYNVTTPVTPTGNTPAFSAVFTSARNAKGKAISFVANATNYPIPAGGLAGSATP